MGVVPKADDGTVTTESIFAKWGRVSLEAGDAFGKTLRIVDESKQGMVDAGFEDVEEHRYKIPLGGWSKDPKMKELGLYNRMQWEQGLEGWCMFLLTNYLGWQYEEVQKYIADMRKMLRDRSVHAYQEVYVSTRFPLPLLAAKQALTVAPGPLCTAGSRWLQKLEPTRVNQVADPRVVSASSASTTG